MRKRRQLREQITSITRHRPRADARFRHQSADLLHHHRRVRQGVGPRGQSADLASRQPEDEDSKSIQIQILDNGEIWVDNRAVDVRAVRANVERMSAVNPDSGVLILAQEQAPTGTLVEVVDQVHLGGIYNITFTHDAVDGTEGSRAMQSRRHAPESEDTGIDLAPMLDFTINLLIFFIITTSFIKEAGITVFKPEAETADRSRLRQLADRDPRERRHLDGSPTQSTCATFAPLMERLHIERPDDTVVIIADRESDAGVVAKVMDEVRLAGIRRCRSRPIRAGG